MLKVSIHQPGCRILHPGKRSFKMMTNEKTDSHKQKLNECAANLH